MCRFLTGKKPTKRAALALLRFSAFTLLLVGWGTSGQAQNTIDNVGSAEIQLELNSLAPNENACRVTFVIKNDQPQTLDQLAFEMVLFDTKGGVDRMTKFDFGKTWKPSEVLIPSESIGSLSVSIYAKFATYRANFDRIRPSAARATVEGIN